jgi:hypothetical protein
MTKETFDKILIARHSPQNSCNLKDGEILLVKPKNLSKGNSHVAHYFIGASTPKLKSKYGWVKKVDPFSIDEFICKHIGQNISEEERDTISIMLRSISKLSDDTPVATTYSRRGIENPKMELTIHKVFFF